MRRCYQGDIAEFVTAISIVFRRYLGIYLGFKYKMCAQWRIQGVDSATAPLVLPLIFG